MAYVIFTANGDEIERRELTGAAVTIGRAQDADIPVRDILLSRSHCRIEPSGEHWIVTDLGSKNGTYLGYRQVTRHQLRDGDELRLGRTRMTFKAGAFEPAPPGTRRREVVRPSDPTDAMAGTVAGFILVEPGEVEREAGAPVPQPRPPEPSAFASEDVYGMLNEIASSSWDSIMAQASRPLVMERPLPRPSGYRPAPARRTRVAFSLQAPVADVASIATTPADATSPPDVTDLPRSPRAPRRTRWLPTPRWWKVPAKVRHHIAVAVVSGVATALLVGAWVIAVNHGPHASAAAPLPKPKPRDVADITFPAPAALPVAAPVARPTGWNASIARDRSALRIAGRMAAMHLLIVH